MILYMPPPKPTHFADFTAADRALIEQGYIYEGQDGMLGHIYAHHKTGAKQRCVGAFQGGYDICRILPNAINTA